MRSREVLLALVNSNMDFLELVKTLGGDPTLLENVKTPIWQLPNTKLSQQSTGIVYFFGKIILENNLCLVKAITPKSAYFMGLLGLYGFTTLHSDNKNFELDSSVTNTFFNLKGLEGICIKGYMLQEALEIGEERFGSPLSLRAVCKAQSNRLLYFALFFKKEPTFLKKINRKFSSYLVQNQIVLSDTEQVLCYAWLTKNPFIEKEYPALALILKLDAENK